ncbi:hypothetical protein [Maritalea sp.]|uniref:hypothetical protein n=1 Tax=Maritalea sp. TaxID=2003361 RepID=UPI003EF8F2E4
MYLISDYQETEQAFEEFRQAVVRQGRLHPDTHVGWPGGHVIKNVYWFQNANVWCLPLRSPPKKPNECRHWICFGISNPAEVSQHSITLEINPPHSGQGKGPSGAFLKDDRGQLYIAHSGKVGGSKKGMTRAAFIEFCSVSKKQFINERGQDMFIFGPFCSNNWIDDLSVFIHEVAAFKEKFKKSL